MFDKTSGIPLEEIDALFGMAVAADFSTMDGKTPADDDGVEIARIETVPKTSP